MVDKNRRFMLIGGIALFLIVIAFMFMSKDETQVEPQKSTVVKAELQIKGLLHKDPRDEQLILYERWEEPYYGLPHIVSVSSNIDLTSFMNRIVLMGANSEKKRAEEKDQGRITAVSVEEVKELTEKERAQWIRFLILNDLDRILSQQQARLFINKYPGSEYIPDIYKYLAQVYLYDTAFQKAVDVLSEFISNYPENDFYIEKFKREIDRIKQTYLIYPAYGKFIASQGEWQLLSSDDLSRHVPTLLQALVEVKTVANKGVDRSGLIELLSRSGSEEAIEFLLDYQKEAEKTDRLAVSKYMQSYIGRKDVKKYYIQSLDSKSASLRLQAAQTLGEAEVGAATVDRFISLLEDSDERVVGASAFALGKIGDRKAVDPLEKLVDSSNPLISSAARIALKKIRNK